MSTAVRVLIAGVVIVLAACSTGSGDQFKQTWTKPYGDTTCADWDNAMTVQQRFVMGADFLVTMQKRDLGGRDLRQLPGENIMRAFSSAMSNQCSDNHTMPVSWAATIVYDDNPDLFEPTSDQ